MAGFGPVRARARDPKPAKYARAREPISTRARVVRDRPGARGYIGHLVSMGGHDAQHVGFSECRDGGISVRVCDGRECSGRLSTTFNLHALHAPSSTRLHDQQNRNRDLARDDRIKGPKLQRLPRRHGSRCTAARSYPAESHHATESAGTAGHATTIVELNRCRGG